MEVAGGTVAGRQSLIAVRPSCSIVGMSSFRGRNELWFGRGIFMTDSTSPKANENGDPAESGKRKQAEPEDLTMPPPPAGVTSRGTGPGRKPLFGR